MSDLHFECTICITMRTKIRLHIIVRKIHTLALKWRHDFDASIHLPTYNSEKIDAIRKILHNLWKLNLILLNITIIVLLNLQHLITVGNHFWILSYIVYFYFLWLENRFTVTLDKLLFNIQRLCHYPKPQSGNYWNNDIHQLKSKSLWENKLHFFSFKVSSHMCFHDYCNQTVYSFSTSE